MLFFCTNTPFVSEHWESVCKDEEALHVKGEKDLFVLLKKYPDAIVLIHMPFFENHILLEVLEKIHSSFENARAVIFSDTPSLEEAKPLLLLNIYGYANARLAAAHLIQVLNVVRAGSVWLAPNLLQQMIQQIPVAPVAPPQDFESILTSREIEIAHYIAKGYTNKQIAKAAFITEHTVKVHLRSIFEKLDIHDRLSLALKFRDL